MANDQPFLVRWQAGQIVVHTASAKSAIEVALEYLRADRLQVQPVAPLGESEN